MFARFTERANFLLFFMNEQDFDFSAKTALRLEAQAKIYFGDLQTYLNSGVSYDFALWVALKPDEEGKKPEFEDFEATLEEMKSKDVEGLTKRLTDIMGFFITIVLRNMQLAKEKKQELRELWMRPFWSANPIVSES